MKLLKKLSYATLFVLVAMQSVNLKAQEPQSSWAWTIGKPVVALTAACVSFLGFSFGSMYDGQERKNEVLTNLVKLEQGVHQFPLNTQKKFNQINAKHHNVEPAKFTNNENLEKAISGLHDEIAEKYLTKMEYTPKRYWELASKECLTAQDRKDRQPLYKERKDYYNGAKYAHYGIGTLGALVTAGVIGSYFWPKK